jgi:uncharacterized repeat protein (TIGR02543 family)
VRFFLKLAFSLAIGVCAVSQTLPTLSISVSHTGTFLLGQTNAFFVIRVSNVGTGPTTSAVQVTDHTVTGMQITSLGGPGWSCSNVTCVRSDVLAAGQTYPAIIAQGTVYSNAPATITYGATVYFGGDPNTHGATDTANVVSYGYPVAWGGDQSGESLVPTGLTNVVALSGGGSDTLALLGNGTVLAWGDNTYGQTTVPAGLTKVLSVAAGDMHSLALESNGTVVAWGDNSAGERTVPNGLAGVVAIATGHAFSLALKGDGTVVAWGDNSHGQCTVPAGLKNVKAITAGWWHSVALKNDGTVVAWGYNVDGESTPTPGLKNVTAIVAGAYHTLALKSDGTVAAWGVDTSGQIDVPSTVIDAVAIAAGWDHSLALLADGTVVPWGYAGYGQLATPGGLTDITSLAAGGYHSLAVTSIAYVTMPIVVQASATAVSSLGSPNLLVDSIAVSGSGVLFNWAPGTSVYVGGVWEFLPGASHTLSVAPLPVGTGVQYVFSSWSDGGTESHTVSPVAPTTYTAYFTTQYQLTTASSNDAWGSITPADGAHWYGAGSVAGVTATPSTGYSFTGWSGGACSTQSTTCNVTMNAPASVTANFVPTASMPAPILSLSSSHSGHFLQGQSNAVYLLRVSTAITAGPTNGTTTVTDTLPAGLTLVSMSGEGWNCTANACSRSDTLPNGQSYPAILLVVKVAAGAAASVTNVANLSYATVSNVATASDVTAIAATGYPLAWGLNTNGQSTVPAGLTNVVSVAGGTAHSLALKADGTVVAWGDNSHGQSTVPTGLTGVMAIAAGAYHSLALTTAGTVVAWGDDTYGQTIVPAALTSPTCSTQPCAVAIAAGAYHNLALMSDGTVIGWGYDLDGETDVPASLANVVGIAAGATHSVAVTSSGAVVAWGSNAFGQTNVPAGLSGIVAVAAGANHSLALSATGTVAAWGDNTYGQITVPSSLAGVVAAIAAGGDHSLALKKTGTISAWGDNTDGQDAVSAGLTNVTAIAAGTSHSLAVSTGASGSVAITLTTSQPGTIITADGTPVPANVILDWAAGSSHTIAAPTPQSGPAGTHYVFVSWSDGGAASHAVTPAAATTYKATFSTQYLLIAAVNNAAAGAILPATGWYNPGTLVSVTATAKPGYKFSGWSGACTGTAACKVTMSAPQSVTANFGALPSNLSITSTHTGNFYRGEPVAHYTLKITDAATAGPTSGTVFVTEYVPAGMTLVSISGAGWSCSGATCSRTDSLAPGASYPPISVGVYVSLAAPLSSTNGANVGGGGSPSSTASDPTKVSPTAP